MENNIVTRIVKRLMLHFGVSKISEVLDKIDVNKGTYDSWRHRGHIPIKPLKKISMKTGIPIAELMSENEGAFSIPPSLKNAIMSFSQDETKLIDMFRTLDREDQKRIYADIKELFDKKSSFSFSS